MKKNLNLVHVRKTRERTSDYAVQQEDGYMIEKSMRERYTKLPLPMRNEEVKDVTKRKYPKSWTKEELDFIWENRTKNYNEIVRLLNEKFDGIRTKGALGYQLAVLRKARLKGRIQEVKKPRPSAGRYVVKLNDEVQIRNDSKDICVGYMMALKDLDPNAKVEMFVEKIVLEKVNA